MELARERELYDRMKAGDAEAKNELAIKVLPWAQIIAARYGRKFMMNRDDSDEAANVAVAEALNRWDIDRGRLSTTVVWSVRSQVNQQIYNLAGPLRLPAEQGVRGKRHHAAWVKGLQRSYSLDAPLPSQTDWRKGATHGDLLADQLPSILDDACENERLAHLRQALAQIPKRERLALEQCVMRGVKLHVLGAELGISKERVRQLKVRGILRLRAILRKQPVDLRRPSLLQKIEQFLREQPHSSSKEIAEGLDIKLTTVRQLLSMKRRIFVKVYRRGWRLR